MLRTLLIIGLACLLPGLSVQAQSPCTPYRYSADSLLFPENEDIVVQTAVSYGQADDWQGNPFDLVYDIAYPDLARDPEAKRPLILLVHGGAFLIGNRSEMFASGEAFARRGYVAAVINYRQGWNFGTFFCDGDPFSLLQAGYRGTQDCRAALRQLVDQADTYGIDTSQIFLYGYSAGAIIALQTAYLNQAEVDSLDANLSATLGGLDETGNALQTDFSIKGVFSISGALSADTAFMDEPIPLGAIHGDDDPIIPYESGAFFNCPNAPLSGFGSKALIEAIAQRGLCHEFSTDNTGAGHEPFNETYFIRHATCFFRGIMCGNCTSTISNGHEVSCDGAPTSLAAGNPWPGIELFPQPARDHLQLRMTQAPVTPLQLQLLDLTGREQARQTWPAGQAEHSLAVRSLPGGFYLLRLESAEGQWVRKIWIE